MGNQIVATTILCDKRAKLNILNCNLFNSNSLVPTGVIVVNSVKEAIESVVDDDQPFIIGGGEIYEQALKYASVIELTRVHSTFVGDTFFPKIDHEKWIEVNREDIFKDENHNYDLSFITYKKINL